MVSLARSKAVLDLGKRLVAQLGDAEDLLAHWMAHDIAARIRAVEEAVHPDTKSAAQEACSRAILDLWQHRHSLPTHLRPLGELEPILRTLASLDVARDDFRYFPQVLREAATSGADENTKKWLDLACGLDYSARLLIQYALRSAAADAASNAEPWVDLAIKAGADALAELSVVKFIVRDSEELETEKSKADDALRDELSRLEGFVQLASVRAAQLRSQLECEQSDPESDP